MVCVPASIPGAPSRGNAHHYSEDFNTPLMRPRLNSLLNTGREVAILVGIDGSGKTSAMNAWGNYLVERGDTVLAVSDSGRRLRGFRADQITWSMMAERSAHPTSLNPLKTTAIRTLVDRVASELRGTKRRLTILVDSDSDDVVEQVEMLAARAQAQRQIRLVLATCDFERAERWAAQFVHCDLITADELAFTYDEVLAAVHERSVPASDEAVRQVVDLTGGFAAATAYAISMLADSSSHEWTSEDSRALAESTRVSALESLRESFDEDAMMRLAVPATLNDASASFFIGQSEGPTQLRRAAALGLGRWRGSPDSSDFHVHPYFRAVMSSRRPNRSMRELEDTFSQWALENDQAHQSLKFAIDRADYRTASHVIMMAWQELVTVNRVETLDALALVPAAERANWPLIPLVLAIGYSRDSEFMHRSADLLSVALTSARQFRPALATNDKISHGLVETVVLRLMGRQKESVDAAAKMLQSLEALSEDEGQAQSRNIGITLLQAGLSFLEAGDSLHAFDCFSSIETHLSPTPADLSQQRVLEYSRGLLACAAAMSGDMVRAGSLRGRFAPEPSRTGSRRDWVETDFCYDTVEILAMLERGKWADSLAAIDEAREATLPMDHLHHLIEPWFIAKYALGQSAQAVVDIGAWRQDLLRHGQSVDRAGLWSSRVRLILGFGTNDLVGIDKLLAGRNRLGQIEHRLQCARLALMRSQHHEVHRRLASIRTKSNLTIRQQIDLELISAAVSAVQEAEEPALRHLKQAFDVMDSYQVWTPSLFIPEKHRVMLTELAQSNGFGPYVDSRIDELFPSPILDVRSRILLTDREKLVLRALVETARSADIAQQLFVSVNTVKTQRRSLYRKLNVASRDEALLVAYQQGLLGHHGE